VTRENSVLNLQTHVVERAERFLERHGSSVHAHRRSPEARRLPRHAPRFPSDARRRFSRAPLAISRTSTLSFRSVSSKLGRFTLAPSSSTEKVGRSRVQLQTRHTPTRPVDDDIPSLDNFLVELETNLLPHHPDVLELENNALEFLAESVKREDEVLNVPRSSAQARGRCHGVRHPKTACPRRDHPSRSRRIRRSVLLRRGPRRGLLASRATHRPSRTHPPTTDYSPQAQAPWRIGSRSATRAASGSGDR
jgi:hypothetical protein